MSNPIDKKVTEQLSKSQQAKLNTNKYIDDVVTRYLPAGSNYIIIDENCNVITPGRKDI